MKKIIAIAILMMLSVTSSYASPGYALKHANPMPNLVRYTLGNAELLQLEKAQIKEIRAWAGQNKPKMQKLIQLVMREEKMLLQEALTTDIDVPTKAKVMLDARAEIITIKTACRAHLKKVLTPKQYSQVIGIYRSTLPMNPKK